MERLCSTLGKICCTIGLPAGSIDNLTSSHRNNVLPILYSYLNRLKNILILYISVDVTNQQNLAHRLKPQLSMYTRNINMLASFRIFYCICYDGKCEYIYTIINNYSIKNS